MKWPWTARVSAAQERAAEAGRKLETVRGQWEDVRSVVGQSRENRFSEDHLFRLFQDGRHRG